MKSLTYDDLFESSFVVLQCINRRSAIHVYAAEGIGWDSEMCVEEPDAPEGGAKPEALHIHRGTGFVERSITVTALDEAAAPAARNTGEP